MSPRVSIGVPVFNGENFLRTALDSIRAQSFRDFEVIICDNASQDGTEEIAREFARLDDRFVYFRNEHNIGAAPNFNKTFHLASGKYFKWAAHDDVILPDYLQECVAVLDRDDGVVLCHCATDIVDARGRIVRRYEPRLDGIDALSPCARLWRMSSIHHYCFDVFGLIRSENLAQTPLIASFIASDRCLLVELSLHGKCHRLDRALFQSRDHPARSIEDMKLHERGAWFDPTLADRLLLPHLRMLAELWRSTFRVPLGIWSRLGCLLLIPLWATKYRRLLWWDTKLLMRARFWRRRRDGEAGSAATGDGP